MSDVDSLKKQAKTSRQIEGRTREARRRYRRTQNGAYDTKEKENRKLSYEQFDKIVNERWNPEDVVLPFIADLKEFLTETQEPCKCGSRKVIAKGLGCHDQHVPHSCMEEIMKGSRQCEIVTCVECGAIRNIHSGEWRIYEALEGRLSAIQKHFAKIPIDYHKEVWKSLGLGTKKDWIQWIEKRNELLGLVGEEEGDAEK